MATPTADRIPTRRSGGFATKFGLILAFVLVVALAIFALQNTVHTNVNFIGWNFELAQGVWLLGAAAVGAVIALIVSAALRVRRAIK
ncbi:MAG: lipopolysaccharide assembly protein LapA domain-containing protein [Mycobacterium sp.]